MQRFKRGVRLMELLVASLIEHMLGSPRFAPDGSDPDEVAFFDEWSTAIDWDRKALAAAKAIGANLDSPPTWALLTCFVCAENDKRSSSNAKSKVKKGYALDLLIFYLLEADERHRADLENRETQHPPSGPQSDKPYVVAEPVSLDKAARWVCGKDDEEFDRSELILRDALRRFQEKGTGSGVVFTKRTLLRAWTEEQDEAPGCGNEPEYVDGYKNTDRMKRVAKIWEAWRMTLSEGDPNEGVITPEYAGLFKLLFRSQ